MTFMYPQFFTGIRIDVTLTRERYVTYKGHMISLLTSENGAL